ncbi:helix-turn-helix domain-containing protein [Longirhabdus pacifica]|uniref:helix-turn-helix domain-containing protein n=1 Tax=Longirhabdus pacifica TaxID=2305227 RepID=UPI001008892A|nr:helix-turn-helix domain-containing protein [Longirhabdus pacifica]
MEKKDFAVYTNEDHMIESYFEKAKTGDKKALEIILAYFDEEIQYLSKYIRLPKEDAMQSIRTELIAYILQLDQPK